MNDPSPPADRPAQRPSRRRSILHVDMDAFYAAVEQRENPSLRGRPVIVGASPQYRGVVSAASYEARAFGVRSAMPSVKAGQLCPQAVFLPVNMALYQEVSRQVMAILGRYTPLVEPLSVDEAFLDVTGSWRLFGEAEQIGHDIRRCIREELDLTASVGLASSKFLAKLATELGKPDGFVVVPEGQEVEFLRPLPVSALWGVGKATLQVLESLGIRTVGQLADYPAGVLERKLGVSGQHLRQLSLGLDPRAVTPHHDARSVSAERTFQVDTADRERLERLLLALSEDVGGRLRAQDLRGRTVQLKLRWEDFTTITRQRTLPQPSQADKVIYEAVRELFRAEPLEGRKVRLIGVGVSGFTEPAQPSLFGADEETPEILDRTMDSLRKRFGADSLKRGRLVDE